MKDRIKELRKFLDLSQELFGEKIGLSKSAISNIESGRYNVTDTIIITICNIFIINEHWLRTGEGNMFIESDSFSLDEYIKKKGLSEFAVEIVKSFVMMPKDIQEPLLNYLKDYFSIGSDEIAATKDRLPSDVSDAADEALQLIESKKEKLI